MTMPHVVVIGREGQLARALAESAAQRPDLSLTCLGRAQVDIADPASIEAGMKGRRADIILNTAAYTAVDRAEAEPQAAFAVNRDGAGWLADFCEARQLPLIHLSTDYVFSGSKQGSYNEDDPCDPQSVYGRSKYDGEQAVLSRCRRAVVLRTSWVHSPYGSNFVLTMLRLTKERDRIRVVNDQRGAPTYAPDLAMAILGMAERLAGGGATPDLYGRFHLVGSGVATWHDVACAIMAAAAEAGAKTVPVDPITTAEYPTPARRPANSVLSTHKIERTYGLRMPAWQDGVRRCVARALAPEQR